MSDLPTLARAFRSAIDEDTRVALNVQSTRTGLGACVWYVVPFGWAARAWPLLLGTAEPSPTWRQELAIENAPLVAGAVPSGTDGSAPFQERHAVLVELRQTSPGSSAAASPARLRAGCAYGRDYLLVGANAWLLAGEKFGYDLEVACPTVLELGAALQVRVPTAGGGAATTVPFPTTGRFPVERALSAAASQEAPTEIKEDHPGNVSDDETDDLFPGTADDNMSLSMDNPQDTFQEPILLLPPSTTSTSLIGDGLNVDMEDDLVGSDIIRRKPYGTGLGNLGNTCFMNSTLQCLAHTDPIRKYFLSGEYEKDLNRNNPLGTGGELAIQFASLLGEMWGASTGTGNGYSARYPSSVVYPRTFKQTLGRHAEQFVGYDQHDSQELAVYLLDALHEDTNRISKKPYVEKPEKEGKESDHDAARKAWELHLKRDDSKVLSFFMGQVKSLVQCCKPDCGRESTTFDNVMYLSVPVPGSSEKTVKFTFVPLDPRQRPQAVSATVNKSGSFKDLFNKMLEDLRKSRILDPQQNIALEDLCAADVWRRQVHNWYKNDDDINQIGDMDDTFVFQMAPLVDIQRRAECITADQQLTDPSRLGLHEWEPPPKQFTLDSDTTKRLDQNDEWANQFVKYISGSGQMNRLNFQMAFNPQRGDAASRVNWYNKTYIFVSRSYKVLGNLDDVEGYTGTLSPDAPPLNSVVEACASSVMFEHVERPYDLAVLHFCLGKMRDEIIRLEQVNRQAPSDGVIIQIRIRKSGSFASNDDVPSFVIRIPSDLTVYGLRQCLASRLARCLRTNRTTTRDAGATTGESTSESGNNNPEDPAADAGYIPSALAVICQVPLAYDKSSQSSGRSYAAKNLNFTPLGSLQKNSLSDEESSRNIADSNNLSEKVVLSSLMRDHDSIIMEWPELLFDTHFDVAEYETVETLPDLGLSEKQEKQDTISVVDCIGKYCQREQLEESEMWYCNRCREHVQAWKKFDLYVMPPILIIHLKRFQYSASTHRRDKIGVFIDFPLKGLDLTNQVSYWKDGEAPIYDCYAVSNHFGGLGGGHYTAHCLNDDGTWAYYDDSRITTNVDPKEVVSAAAYCLYYRRRDVLWGEEFPINLHTPSLHAPVIISDTFNLSSHRNVDDDVSSTHAAMVDEEEGMDLDDVGNDSRATSPMGSIDDHSDRDHFDDHDYDPRPLLQ